MCAVFTDVCYDIFLSTTAHGFGFLYLFLSFIVYMLVYISGSAFTKNLCIHMYIEPVSCYLYISSTLKYQFF